MIYLVYASAAQQDMSESDLENLLAQSRVNNEKTGITGMMLYDGGKFIQAIEGNEDAIDALYEKIKKDKRNTDQIVIERTQVSERIFESWSMGYRRIKAANRHEIDGYSDIFDSDLSSSYYQENADRVKQLLKSFIQYL